MRAFGPVVRTALARGASAKLSQLPAAAAARFSTVASNSRLASGFSLPASNGIFRRTYSSEPSPKKEDSKKEGERLLPTSGPLSPFGITLFLLTAGGIMYYFTVTKERIKNERLQNKAKEEVVGKPNVGGPFELVDQDGSAVTDAAFHGKFALIYFGFCHCPDICPDELDKIGEALEILDRNPQTRDTIQPVFITCDPQRDSPEAIKKYLEEFHPKFVGLTGSIDQVRKACKAFRVYFSKPPKVEDGQDYLVDHSIFSYFMDPDGQFIDVYGKDKSALAMASDIERRISQFLATGRTVETK